MFDKIKGVREKIIRINLDFKRYRMKNLKQKERIYKQKIHIKFEKINMRITFYEFLMGSPYL